MGDKYQIRKKKATPAKISKERETADEEQRGDGGPLFCFKHLDLNVSLKGCDHITYKHFVHRLCKMSELTWEQINRSGKHQLGFELIPKKQIKQKKFPPIVTDDMEKLPVFRYTGDNHPFVCVIQRGVIYPIFIEANFGDVYNHG